MKQNLYSLILNLPEGISEPNHYELLGIETYSDNEKQIRTAALEKNRLLLSWQNSDQHHGRVREMMLKVVEAKRVLLDPDLKRKYDRQLTSEQDQFLQRIRPTPSLAIQVFVWGIFATACISISWYLINFTQSEQRIVGQIIHSFGSIFLEHQ